MTETEKLRALTTAAQSALDCAGDGVFGEEFEECNGDCESFTRDLLAIIRKERAARVRACDECHA